MSEPNSDHSAELLALAEEAAKLAGTALRANRESWSGVVAEFGKDVKAEADSLAETLILQCLENGSDIPILAEESGAHGEVDDDTFRWIVDPLDGTANYLQGIPFCCVAIALARGGEPLLGVIHDFNHDETYSGLVGGGAWLNGASMQVSRTPARNKAVLNTGFPAGRDFSDAALTAFAIEAGAWRKVRMMGSAALSLAYVACGRSDAYREEGIMVWDVMAGIALVRAAGGEVKFSSADHNTNRLDEVFAHNGCLATQ